MTLQSYYYQKPKSANFNFNLNLKNPLQIKKLKRFSLNCFIGCFSNQSGKAKISFILGVALLSLSLMGFIYSQTVLTNLDYKISDIKSNIKVIEKENSDLKAK